ncbi:MAG: phosphatase PAP2 family protein [Euryarchaeota archaeon]|nr:phosphatase PAP2 family protein [Euryarchaeota archaeon]
MAWQLIVFSIISTLILIALYFSLFVSAECRKRKRGYTARQLINGYWPYILAAAAVYGLVQVQFPIRQHLHLLVNYDCTAYIEQIEGSMVAGFQSMATPALTYLMTFVYIVFFSSVVIFTFIVLAYTEQTSELKRFSLVFILNYLIAFPFYLLFPVTVTGYALPNVQPLMYELHPDIYSAITMVDPLDNCFPSLHVALMFSTFLIIYGTNLRRYRLFLIFAFPTVVFATLYLGVHWAIDIIAGMALSVFTLHIADRYGEQILRHANTAIVEIERLIGVKETVICNMCACKITTVPHIRSVSCPQCGTCIEHSAL